jgi:cyclopropane-fatty-acyl-phospholipid synthase
VTSVPEVRACVARDVLWLARRALAPDAPIEVALAADVLAERTTAVRVVVAGPDAAARLLWPPSPDAMAEAYLRGDIDIEGDIWAAIDRWTSFSCCSRAPLPQVLRRCRCGRGGGKHSPVRRT